MFSINDIPVPVDFSKESILAAKFAVSLAIETELDDHKCFV